jgi:hypothetical protein
VLGNGRGFSSICCRGAATGAHQTLILHVAIVLGRKDFGATLAFLLAADIAHDGIVTLTNPSRPSSPCPPNSGQGGRHA